jgi:hypothetical protein
MEERAARPFRFSAENVDDVFAVLKDFTVDSARRSVRAAGAPSGRRRRRPHRMPHLPSSRRQVIMGSGRSNTTAFVSSTVKIVPTNHVMSGAADFQITIDKDVKIDTGNAGKREPGAPNAPKNEQPKPAENPKPNSASPSETPPAQ